MKGNHLFGECVPYLNHEGERNGIVVTFSDVTEILASEELLTRSLKAARMDAFEVDLKTKHATRKGVLSDAIGITSTDTLDDYIERIHAADRELFRSAYRACTVENPEYLCTYRFKNSDGKYLWLCDDAEVVFDEHGTAIQLVGTRRDVSNTKRTQLALLDRERQMRTIADALPPLISFVDKEFRYQFANAAYAKQFGRQVDEFIGKRIADVVGQKAFEAIQPHLDQAFKGSQVTYELELPDPVNGSLTIKEVTYIPETNDFGDVIGCHVLAVDMTERKHVEEMHAENEMQLRRVIDNMICFVGILDRAGTLLEVNQTALAAGGLKRSDVVGKKFWDCYWWNFDPDIREQLKKQFQQALDGEPVRYDVDVRMANDTRITIDFMMVPVRTNNGTITHVIPSGVDISDRKNSELLASATLDHLQLALEAGRMGTWQWEIPTDSMTWSDNTFEMFGLEPDEFGGTLNDFTALIHADDHADVGLEIEQVLNGEKDAFEIESRCKRPSDGQVIWILARATVRRDSEGNPLMLIGVVTDITDRKKNELELVDREQRLAMALRAGGMAAWEWRPTESFWTPELFELMEISPDQTPCPETFFQHVHPDDVESLKVAWQKATTENQSYDHEFRVIRRDGEIRWIVGTGEFHFNDDGTVKRLYGLNWDNTPEHLAADALRDSEQRAMAASESKSEFLANMSHEIRTPMSAILGYADILARHLKDPDDLNCVSIIRSNGKFLLEIINDILDISKIEAGKIELSKKVFRLDTLVADVGLLMQVRAVEKLIDFTVEIDGRIPQDIKSDSKRLKQILVNLIGNAIKFTESGSVRLVVRSLKKDASHVQFDVIDTGIGMTAEQQTRLFQPFSQGDASVARRFGGTGLGLAISERLAEMLGGEISVESEPGKGSTFSLTIAAGKVENVAMVGMENWEVAPPKILPGKTDKVRLDGKFLVVDDRREIRFIAQHFIEDAGGKVVTGENGQEAIDAVAEANAKGQPFDIVVMDMQMPVLDGYEATRRLRKSGFQQPIIALTAHAMEGDRDECLKAGCTDYIPKPLDGPAFTKLLFDNRSSEPSVPNTPQRRILVVDDSQHAREAISTLLTFNGHTVRSAADGVSSVKLAESFEPEIVLLDLGLPDISGFEAFEQLRKIPALSATRFIATTGHDNFDATLAAGFHHHIVKPVDLDELEDWLRNS